jgi:adenosine deaminase
MRRLRTSAIVSRVWGWVWIGWVGILALAAIAAGQSPEEKTAKYMESVRHQPELLLPFLQAMPKGGDLHVHLYGAIYAESMIDWASENALCVDRSTSKLIHAACDSCEPYRNKPSVRCAYQDHILYDQLVDAWSMRNWHAAEESGHDHFFATFDKFGPAFEKHVGDALAEVASRAAADHLAICGADAYGGWRRRGDAGRKDWVG